MTQPERHWLGEGRHGPTPEEVAAAIASCPGYEATPNPCHCPCYGCKHHCSAHQPEPECNASISGSCLAESEGGTGCSTEGGECVHAPTPADLRDRYAAAIYEYNNPGHRWADAHPDDLICYGAYAYAALAVRDRELEQLRVEVVELRQRFDNQAQAGGELIDERRQLEERIRRECDRLQAAAVLADGEPHTDRERGIVAAVTRVLAALNPQEQS